MVEKDIIFNTSMKYKGLFDMSGFYQFCYDWLIEETEMVLTETKYKEKITGDSKEVHITWEGYRKLTDYFKFSIKIKYLVVQLKTVEVNQNGKKIKTNQGEVKMMVKSTLERDWQGKFETTAFRKFLRSIYEKYIIASRIDQMEEKVIDETNEYLNQAKAFLDLEAKRSG